jgi:hypothetical protein
MRHRMMSHFLALRRHLHERPIVAPATDPDSAPETRHQLKCFGRIFVTIIILLRALSVIEQLEYLSLDTREQLGQTNLQIREVPQK